MLFIAFKIENNKKVDVETSTQFNSKDKYRDDLEKREIEFDGIDSIKNI